MARRWKCRECSVKMKTEDLKIKESTTLLPIRIICPRCSSEKLGCVEEGVKEESE